jgi:hypothetical protein
MQTKIKIGTRPFEQFRYLGMTVSNQNLIQEGIKSRLNSGNGCHHSVLNLLSYLLSKNIKVRIYKTIILHVVLREEHKLKVFENRVLWRIFGLKKDEVMGGCRKLHNEELHDLYYFPYKVEEDEMGGTCGTDGREEECV